MTAKDRRGGLSNLWHAFDEARFNGRTLNLRESLPTAAEASRRAESWLREQQVAAAGEVLVVTGRGNNSEGGVSPVREAVIRLLHLLRRRGVVSGHAEHTAGSFVVQLASMQALIDAPKRSRDTAPAPKPAAPPSLDALSEDTRTLLRDLAERILESLGVQDKDPFMRDEMLRQFGLLAAGIGADTPDREAALQAAIRRTLDEYE
ncbi:MAG: hypothetical protein H0X64_11875 [Gemmatimonadaceae bacterium]|nr:hypothetical protein [Gemmatimonadaceae bacterium]